MSTIVTSILSRYAIVFEPPIRVPGVIFEDRKVDTEDTFGFTEYMLVPFLRMLKVTFEDAELEFTVNRGGIVPDMINGNGALKVSFVPVVSVVVSSESAPPKTTG
jgi:hypothetical protein